MRRIVWAEGILLSQQHLQQWQRELETKIRRIQQYNNPNQWGIVKLEIEEAFLLNGVIKVNACSALLKNGTYIDYNTEHGQSLQCELATDPVLTVYLCMPENNLVYGVSGYDAPKYQAGWQAEYIEALDDLDASRKCEVLYAEPSLFLTTHKAIAEQHAHLAIAKFEYLGSQQYRRIANYIPACINLSAASALTSGLINIIEMIKVKLHEILCCQTNQHDINGFIKLDNVVAARLRLYLLRLENLSKQPYQHPSKLYQCYKELFLEIAQLNTCEADMNVADYNHADLTSIFDALISKLLRLLNALLPKKWNPLIVLKQTDTLYEAKINDALNANYYLAVLNESKIENWVAAFLRQVKILSPLEINSIINTAVSGLHLTHVKQIPANVPFKSGYEYFSLDTCGRYWQEIKNEHALAIYVPITFKNLNLELFSTLQ